MFSLKEYREPTQRLPDYLPWAALVAPGVILQKEHILQKTIAFRGPDLGSSSSSELMSSVARLNNALKRLGSGWAMFIEAQRFETDDYPEAVWPTPASWLVDIERKNSFKSQGSHYESSYFITFVWELPGGKTKKFERVFYDDPEEQNEELDNNRDLEYFQKTVNDLVNIMQGVFADVAELNDDETLSYLHSTISTNRHPIKTPDIPMYLDALLPDQAFTLGDIPMLGNHFMPTITINGFPSTSLPGLLDELNHLRIEYRWVSRFIGMDKDEAKSELEKYRKRWWSKRKGIWTMIKEEASKEESALVDNDAANKAADSDAALQELGDDIAAFGYFTSTISVWDEDIAIARENMAKVRQVVQNRGFAVKDETMNGLEAWLGSLPGHVFANVRRPIINTLNLAHIMPLSAIWAGNQENKHLKEKTGVGSPHIVCNTEGDTAFRLNLNVGDVGHTFIGGPTGAGKSTLLGTLALQFFRYPNAQVIFFDKDRSARATTLACEGLVYEPGNEEAPVSFQPLRRIDERSERIWASQFLQNMLTAQNLEITPARKKLIDDALDNLADDEVKNRTITNFCDAVQDVDIREALRPYTIKGNFGQLFDADHENMEDSHFIMIEMGHLMGMGDEAVVPALDYLFHRIEQKFDGSPTLLVLDEAWLFLAHAVFSGRLKDWLKTLRKKQVYVVFATQEIADAINSPICPTILSACHTKIYLPDEEALNPEMYEAYHRFGLSDAEITLIQQSQKKRDYYYRSVSGRRLFNLNLGEVALAFVGMSDQDDQPIIDKIVEKFKPDQFAAAVLKHKRLDWAVDLLMTEGKKSVLTT